MALICEQRGDYLLLRPADEWDEHMQSELARTLRGALAAGSRGFVVDLAGTIHIRYRVLELLLALHRELRRSGAELVLASPSFYLMEILAAGDVPRSIPVYPSEASAALGIRHTSAAFSLVPREGESRGSGLVF